MKLKTLKELDILGDKNSKYERILISDLKQEAIKEIKTFRFLNKIPDVILDDIIRNKDPVEVVVNYIKWKNNLTEEDLK